jgi:hypothetical protein
MLTFYDHRSKATTRSCPSKDARSGSCRPSARRASRPPSAAENRWRSHPHLLQAREALLRRVHREQKASSISCCICLKSTCVIVVSVLVPSCFQNPTKMTFFFFVAARLPGLGGFVLADPITRADRSRRYFTFSAEPGTSRHSGCGRLQAAGPTRIAEPPVRRTSARAPSRMDPSEGAHQSLGPSSYQPPPIRACGVP